MLEMLIGKAQQRTIEVLSMVEGFVGYDEQKEIDEMIDLKQMGQHELSTSAGARQRGEVETRSSFINKEGLIGGNARRVKTQQSGIGLNV